MSSLKQSRLHVSAVRHLSELATSGGLMKDSHQELLLPTMQCVLQRPQACVQNDILQDEFRNPRHRSRSRAGRVHTERRPETHDSKQPLDNQGGVLERAPSPPFGNPRRRGCLGAPH